MLQIPCLPCSLLAVRNRSIVDKCWAFDNEAFPLSQDEYNLDDRIPNLKTYYLGKHAMRINFLFYFLVAKKANKFVLENGKKTSIKQTKFSGS